MNLKTNQSVSNALVAGLLLLGVVLACNFGDDTEEAIRAYEQAEQKAKEAAGKFDEASKLKINDKFKEYLSLKVKEYNKRADLVEALKGAPQALIDSENRASFVSHANAANQKAEGLAKEANDLEAQADKLQKDNPDTIKKT